MELGRMRRGPGGARAAGSWPVGSLLDPSGVQEALAKKPPGCTGREARAGSSRARRDLPQVARLCPCPHRASLGQRGGREGSGVGGEEEKGSRRLLPLARGFAGTVPAAGPRRAALAASPALRGPTHGSGGSGGCRDGSHQ